MCHPWMGPCNCNFGTDSSHCWMWTGHEGLEVGCNDRDDLVGKYPVKIFGSVEVLNVCWRIRSRNDRRCLALPTWPWQPRIAKKVLPLWST